MNLETKTEEKESNEVDNNLLYVRDLNIAITRALYARPSPWEDSTRETKNRFARHVPELLDLWLRVEQVEREEEQVKREEFRRARRKQKRARRRKVKLYWG